MELVQECVQLTDLKFPKLFRVRDHVIFEINFGQVMTDRPRANGDIGVDSCDCTYCPSANSVDEHLWSKALKTGAHYQLWDWKEWVFVPDFARFARCCRSDFFRNIAEVCLQARRWLGVAGADQPALGSCIDETLVERRLRQQRKAIWYAPERRYAWPNVLFRQACVYSLTLRKSKNSLTSWAHPSLCPDFPSRLIRKQVLRRACYALQTRDASVSC